jgi:hypothetical protein
MPKPDNKTSALSALLIAVLITAALGGSMIYFIRVIRPELPAWLSMIFYILLAVVGIGYPIYTLGRWSDRLLVRRGDHEAPPGKSGRPEDQSPGE